MDMGSNNISLWLISISGQFCGFSIFQLCETVQNDLKHHQMMEDLFTSFLKTWEVEFEKQPRFGLNERIALPNKLYEVIWTLLVFLWNVFSHEVDLGLGRDILILKVFRDYNVVNAELENALGTM